MHSIFLLLIIRVVHIAENVHGCTDHLHLHGNEVPRFPDLKSPELRGHECIMTHNPPSQILLLSRGFWGITHKWPLSCSMLYDIYPNQRHSQPCKWSTIGFFTFFKSHTTHIGELWHLLNLIYTSRIGSIWKYL